MTKYHVFRFERDAPGAIILKEIFFAKEEQRFNIFSAGINNVIVRRAAAVIFVDCRFQSPI